MSIARFAGVAGAAAGFGTVLLGAFGAHALARWADAHALELWRTATLYQGLHALALLALIRKAIKWCIVLLVLAAVAISWWLSHEQDLIGGAGDVLDLLR